MKASVMTVVLILVAGSLWSAEDVARPTTTASIAATPKPLALPSFSSPLPNTLPAGSALEQSPIFLSGCSANVSCPTPGGGHYTQSCSGTSYCSVVTDYSVDCDGHFFTCNCINACAGDCLCSCYASGGLKPHCIAQCGFC